jgi:3-oxoacyl-[acyl-carrier protein] reductase
MSDDEQMYEGYLAQDFEREEWWLAAQGALHILVNNTAGPPGGPAHAADPEAYLAVFRQHLVAGQVLVQAVLPGMRAARWGRIVNIISTSVKEPIANLGVSNTVRGAVAAWAKTLAGELGPDGITVNNVLPGYTRTQRLEQILAERAAATGKPPQAIADAMLATVPAGRFAEAAEIAAAVAFLCSPEAGYVNGVNLPVDGGRTRSL